MKQTKRILLTGSGAPGWIPIYKCLADNQMYDLEIYGCDMKPQTAGSYYAKKHFSVPAGNDSNYVETIFDLVKKEKIDIILPITDAELIPLAKNRKLFEEKDIAIPISDPQSLDIAMNKITLFDHLEKNKLGNCEYFLVTSLKEFEEAIKKLGYPTKPVCFKPAIAWGSRGFRIINPNINMYDILMNEKPNSTFITYQQSVDILKAAPSFPQLLVMEYLPGKEYTVDIFVTNKEIHYVIPRLRLNMNNGITTEGLIENNKEVINLSKAILTSLPLDYTVGIQFKYDNNGNPKVLEINPRLQGTTVISYGAGINLPYYTILAILGENIPKKTIKFGTHMFRHWEEVFFRDNKKLIL